MTKHHLQALIRLYYSNTCEQDLRIYIRNVWHIKMLIF